MTAIGGFLPLEAGTSPAGQTYHPEGTALASGRACFHAILRVVRPRRVLLPFYICDAIVQPLLATGTPFEFYPIDGSFRPACDLQPSSGELALVVNYFGVQSALAASLSGRLGDRIVLDDTQAFFRLGVRCIWSFNSARKFFGVPDGAFLYGPAAGIGELGPSENSDCDHLLSRRVGDADAWERFKQHEARVGVEPRRMSELTDRLLRAVDMEHARQARQRNFARLHDALGALNTIALPLDGAGRDAPMCYPFLPAADVDREKVVEAGLFVPMLWPEIESRSASAAFAWERLVARRLLPLPIDHRYGSEDMDTIVRRLHQVLQ